MASFIARKNSRVDMLVSRREKEISDSIILYKTGVQNDKSSDKFSCGCPWFLSINQTRIYARRIIINFFRLKRNRIAAIRRINFFLFEREEKNLRLPSFLSSSITFSSYAKNYLPTFFLNGSAKFLEFTYVQKCTVNNHFWFADFLFSYNREMVEHI